MATGRVPTTANSPLTAKGDLFGYSTTQARVAVGNNGETLVADSSTTTGLRWQGDYAAGKNKIINGDFNINQRGFSSTAYSGATFNNYGFDRFSTNNNGDGTTTASLQTFTLGTAPVAGYEGKNFYRAVTSGFTNAASRSDIVQPIESVRTFANETVTISFWAKAGSGTPKIGVELQQVFGTGGSPSANVNTPVGAITIGTTWQRYSISLAVPSIAGKTLGTNNDDLVYIRFWFNAGSDNATRASSIGIQNNTFDLWGVQVEKGSVATAFQTATGTLAGELQAAQRYFYAMDSATAGTNFTYFGVGEGSSTTVSYVTVNFPVTMRTSPTFSSTVASDFQLGGAGGSTVLTAIAAPDNSVFTGGLKCDVASGLTIGRAYRLTAANNKTAKLSFSSEL